MTERLALPSRHCLVCGVALPAKTRRLRCTECRRQHKNANASRYQRAKYVPKGQNVSTDQQRVLEALAVGDLFTLELVERFGWPDEKTRKACQRLRLRRLIGSAKVGKRTLWTVRNGSSTSSPAINWPGASE